MDAKNAWKTIKTVVNDQLDLDNDTELGSPVVRLFVLLIITACAVGLVVETWHWYTRHVRSVGPLATFIGAALVAWAALQQARTARLRHEEQTKADLQRRVTESFSKAAEQLGSDKLAVRLGGIYTMERISLESWKDYWPAMETLSAFVRENSQISEPTVPRTRTDLHAVMTVLSRRSAEAREYELANGLYFDLSNADLRGMRLSQLHLYRARMDFLKLRGADLRNCTFEEVGLAEADLSFSNFAGVNFVACNLNSANMARASWISCKFRASDLRNSDLSGAGLVFCKIDRCNLQDVSLNGANLRQVDITNPESLNAAEGDGDTLLPNGIQRPAHWPDPGPAAQ